MQSIALSLSLATGLALTGAALAEDRVVRLVAQPGPDGSYYCPQILDDGPPAGGPPLTKCTSDQSGTWLLTAEGRLKTTTFTTHQTYCMASDDIGGIAFVDCAGGAPGKKVLTFAFDKYTAQQLSTEDLSPPGGLPQCVTMSEPTAAGDFYVGLAACFAPTKPARLFQQWLVTNFQ